MTTWLVQVGVGSLFVLTCGGLALAWTWGRLGVAAVTLFVVACAIWALALAAILSEYHGADGFVDCGFDCSGVQYLSAIGFLAPPLLISLSALGMLVARGTRWRVRRRGREAS